MHFPNKRMQDLEVFLLPILHPLSVIRLAVDRLPRDGV